jgi:hypothetical protein
MTGGALAFFYQFGRRGLAVATWCKLMHLGVADSGTCTSLSFVFVSFFYLGKKFRDNYSIKSLKPKQVNWA